MSTTITETAPALAPALPVSPVHLPINIQDEIHIPGWVVDLESFRRWARSDGFPRQGRFSFLNGELWVDLTMEQLFSHNQPKTKITAVLTILVGKLQLGYFFADRTLWSHQEAGLCTEPDALFFTWETLKTGRIRLVPGVKEGYVELEGTPDMVLEVISSRSVRKDKKVLRALYHRAGVREYWLVEARQTPPRLDILRHQAEDYVPSQERDGWLESNLFGHEFQLIQDTDPLGYPLYTLNLREKTVAATSS